MHHDNIIAFPPSAKTNRPAQPAIAAPAAQIVPFDNKPFAQRAMARINTEMAVAPADLAEHLAVVSKRTRICSDDWYWAFGARLRAARVRLGISVEAAAEAAGRSVETWLNYERTGRGRITYPLLLFCRRFDVKIDSLFED
jgi:hypothetical protein